jgi:hypothetical protein
MLMYPNVYHDRWQVAERPLEKRFNRSPVVRRLFDTGTILVEVREFYRCSPEARVSVCHTRRCAKNKLVDSPTTTLRRMGETP